MQQKQIHISQPARVDALLDGRPDGFVGCAVVAELGRVEDVGAREGRVGGEVGRDGAAGLALVVVPLGGVEAAVAGGEGGGYGRGGLPGREHVQAEVDLGDGEGGGCAGELYRRGGGVSGGGEGGRGGGRTLRRRASISLEVVIFSGMCCLFVACWWVQVWSAVRSPK